MALTYQQWLQQQYNNPAVVNKVRGMDKDKANKFLQGLYQATSAAPAVSPQPSPPVSAPAVSMNPSRPRGAGIIIDRDKSPPYQKAGSINPNAPAVLPGEEWDRTALPAQSSPLTPTEDTEGALINEYKNLLAKTQPKKSTGILDALFSGVAGIGATLSNNPESADRIRNAYDTRNAQRQADQRGYEKGLLSLMLSKIKGDETTDMKNFRYQQTLSEEDQRKFNEMIGNPLQRMLSRIVRGN